MSKSSYIFLAICLILIGTVINYSLVSSHDDSSGGRGYHGGTVGGGYSGSGGHK